MRRRSVLAAVAGGFGLSLTGCLQRDAPASDSPTITDHTFEMVAADETPADPTLTNVESQPETGTATLTIEGTVTVPNGCTQLELAAAPTVGDESAVTAVAVDTYEDDGMCTQALEDIGYRLTISYEGACPSTVRVTHPNESPAELAVACL